MLPPNPTTAPLGGGVWREDVSLERIAGLLGAAFPADESTGWGDDAAVLERPAGRVAWCVDAGVVGVHLDPEWFALGDLAWRTTVAALSDLAAMGARALGVVVTICAPGDVDVVAVASDAIDAARANGCEVLGGDLSRSQVTTVTVGALGEAVHGRFVPRSGASPGDELFVTGSLGGSAAGLRRRRTGEPLDDPAVLAHRRPVAKFAEGQVAAQCGASAMIDVSDGLARDVRRLAAASGLGVALETVPVADAATMAEALGGGEDYELLLAHPSPPAVLKAFEEAGLAAPHRIGTLVADPAVLELGGAALPDVGWRHGAQEAV